MLNTWSRRQSLNDPYSNVILATHWLSPNYRVVTVVIDYAGTRTLREGSPTLEP
jgi:hypothetical protein